jgi:hypothetical protein
VQVLQRPRARVRASPHPRSPGRWARGSAVFAAHAAPGPRRPGSFPAPPAPGPPAAASETDHRARSARARRRTAVSHGTHGHGRPPAPARGRNAGALVQPPSRPYTPPSGAASTVVPSPPPCFFFCLPFFEILWFRCPYRILHQVTVGTVCSIMPQYSSTNSNIRLLLPFFTQIQVLKYYQD